MVSSTLILVIVQTQVEGLPLRQVEIRGEAEYFSIKLADVHFQNALRSEIISRRCTSQGSWEGCSTPPPKKKKNWKLPVFRGIYFQISGNLDAETLAMGEFGKQMKAPPPQLTEIPYAYVISQSTYIERLLKDKHK